jgi:hypothetical protein
MVVAPGGAQKGGPAPRPLSQALRLTRRTFSRTRGTWPNAWTLTARTCRDPFAAARAGPPRRTVSLDPPAPPYTRTNGWSSDAPLHVRDTNRGRAADGRRSLQVEELSANRCDSPGLLASIWAGVSTRLIGKPPVIRIQARLPAIRRSSFFSPLPDLVGCSGPATQMHASRVIQGGTLGDSAGRPARGPLFRLPRRRGACVRTQAQRLKDEGERRRELTRGTLTRLLTSGRQL